jgi:oxygen-dependent protoporphyrinogen oxidase
MRIIVIGGGITGLTAAYLASRAGHEVLCLDPGQPGGLLKTECHEGFLCEVGPQAVLDNAPDTLALIASLHLEDRVLRANPAAARRFIYAGGRLHPLPSSPPALLRSGLLSWRAKLRLLREPFVRRPAVPDDDETIASFGARRLGDEAARTLLSTFVIGVFAGAADQLAISAALPRLAAMERAHGSLFRAVMQGRARARATARKRDGRSDGAGAARARSLSFRDGISELPAALARALGPRFKGERALALAPRDGGGWRVAAQAAGSSATEHEADAVVVATDAPAAATLLDPLVPEASALRAIETAPVAVCTLGFREVAQRPLNMDLDGYGFLVARGEAAKMLGCQYESSTFPGRAPDGQVLLRCILGGLGAGFDPGVVDRPDAQVIEETVRDLNVVAGLGRQPDFARVWRHPAGIPQPRPGHLRLVAAIDAGLRRHPGLFLLGHAVRGVGVNESIRAATAFAAGLAPGPAD